MEALLQYVWKHKLWPMKPLATTDGESVEVIDSGLQNRNAEPDFFNAKVKIGGTLWVGNTGECRSVLKRDSINCPVLFDNKFFDGNAVKQLGLSSIGDNIVYHDGRVVGKNYSTDELIREVDALLKKM